MRAGRFGRRVGVIALIGATAAGCAGARRDGTAAGGRPNFVIIIADDLGRDDTGAYGNPHVGTPNIDRLAREGERFDRAFLTCSSCSPSRCSILTGRYPHATGAADLHVPLPADQSTFVDALRRAGYYTASIGKWHLGRDANRRFDRVLRDMQGSGATHWVEALRERPKDRPFLFWLASNDPHRPFGSLEGATPHGLDDVVVPPFLADVGETRGELSAYYDAIARLDRDTGRVLQELEAEGLAASTFVLFLSDNGAPFPRAKATLYDSGIATPFIVRYPPRVRSGSVCNHLVSAVDIAPTILDLAGLRPPPSFQGLSFVPLLDHPDATLHEEVFAEQNWHDFPIRLRAVRTGRYEYIRNFYPDLPATPPLDELRSATFRAMRRLRDAGRLPPSQQGCFVVPRPAEELYDTDADPSELSNLAGDRAAAGTLDRMRRDLASWQERTGDRDTSARRPELFDRETGEPLGVAPPPPD